MADDRSRDGFLVQYHVAAGLASGAMYADAKQTELCTYLSASLLGGLLLNAALVMVPIIAREGLEALRGKQCCSDGCH